MIRSVAFIVSLVFLPSLLLVTPVTAQVQCKKLTAQFVTEPIVIDGRFKEVAWQKVAPAKDFIQYTPNTGAPSLQKSEVKILYDNRAVYLSARLYDDHPDSILRQLSARDDLSGNNDYFSVFFDTYNDKQNATFFAVTASGVQADGIVRFDGTDLSWNTAWYSSVKVDSVGWTVEMKIPYSALRFPNKPVQEWGVNFSRYVRRNRETSYWNYVQPSVANVLGQSGVLEGIKDVVSPLRLTLLPYISDYVGNYSGTTSNTLNGGMDIKYGINEGFTLDLTLIPDFGQTLYDNQVLNLSPVEVRYDDKRYFFTEGLSLFNKEDLFYTRRVGGTPVKAGTLSDSLRVNEEIDASPATTRIYNAVKVSGRTKKKLGIGFFNAITAPATATILDTVTGIKRAIQTAPLTNYNVLVLEQALKNSSFISFVNTNVTRAENSYNANVSAMQFKFADKRNLYGLEGAYDYSMMYQGIGPGDGYRSYMTLGKISGEYTWAATARTISDQFNPNDLGYLARNNITQYLFDQSYNKYQPVGDFVRINNFLEAGYYRAFNPDAFMQLNFNGTHSVTFSNYLSAGFYWSGQPGKTHDYLEPRTPGRYYVYPTSLMMGAFISSDYRKKFALDINANNSWFGGSYRDSWYLEIAPRYRFSNKFQMVYDVSFQHSIHDVGYVDNVNDSIYFGTRNINTITNTLDASYIFTNTMSLKLDARHYWSNAVYSAYNYLANDGTLQASNYNTSHDIDFNTFNVYLSYVWQYAPGSEMSIVYQNSILTSNSLILNDYMDNFTNTLEAPQNNSLSVKVIYYLDYLYARSKLTGRG